MARLEKCVTDYVDGCEIVYLVERFRPDRLFQIATMLKEHGLSRYAEIAIDIAHEKLEKLMLYETMR